ncbi:MAG: hypothetical protein AB1791_00785 [Chloroflexota bacterium]
MIVVRDVFQARYGKGGELVQLLRQSSEALNVGVKYGSRILTDASGTFFTVVVETEVESLADWEGRIGEVFARPDFGEWFSQMIPLVESGRREFYYVEG